MEDSFVAVLEAINKIEDEYEPFANLEDIALCYDSDNYESSDCSNSNDEDDFAKIKLFMLSKITLLSKKKKTPLTKNPNL